MTTATLSATSFRTSLPPETSAENIRIRFGFEKDSTLPNQTDFDVIARNPSIIPKRLRVFDLIFPNVVQKGASEGGGADQVIDDSICVLIWNGDNNRWEKGWLLAGSRGWGRHESIGPDHCSPRGRILHVR